MLTPPRAEANGFDNCGRFTLDKRIRESIKCALPSGHSGRALVIQSLATGPNDLRPLTSGCLFDVLARQSYVQIADNAHYREQRTRRNRPATWQAGAPSS